MDTNYIYAQIDEKALISNCEYLKSLKCHAKMCVAVKANAYGHGVEIVVGVLVKAGVDMLAVANFNEARQLLELKPPCPVLVFGSYLSIFKVNNKKQIAEWVVNNGVRITPMLKMDIDSLAQACEKTGKKAYVHTMLDTGMSRMGLGRDDLLELVEYIKEFENIEIEGLYTHLATADFEDKSLALNQVQQFRDFIKILKSRGVEPALIHSDNSAAVIDMPDVGFNMLRVGIAIYGYQPSGEIQQSPELKPAMKVVSKLLAVKDIKKGTYVGYGCTYKADKDMTIGVVPIGYADGYDRNLSNRGKMKVANTIVPIVGRVSMDQTIIDLTEVIKKNSKIKAGYEVIVIDNDRNEPNSVESIAKQLDTIPHEITTGLGPRIVRTPL